MPNASCLKALSPQQRMTLGSCTVLALGMANWA